MYREGNYTETRNDAFRFSYGKKDLKDNQLQLPPYDKGALTSFADYILEVSLASNKSSILTIVCIHDSYLTLSQFENGCKISIIDGLHRCYALLEYLRHDVHGQTWEKLKTCKRTATLKIFTLNKRFRNEMKQPASVKLLNLLKEYSFEIYQQRRATVGHTFFDAIKNTLAQDSKNTQRFKYLTMQADTGDTKQFFTKPSKDRKALLQKHFKFRMQNIHLTMCKTDQYLHLLQDKTGQIVKDSVPYLAGFHKDTDKVSFVFVKNASHVLIDLTFSSKL
jgi:hypothetical protein